MSRPQLDGHKIIGTILESCFRATSYKIVLLRPINDLVLFFPDLAHQERDVAGPVPNVGTCGSPTTGRS